MAHDRAHHLVQERKASQVSSVIVDLLGTHPHSFPQPGVSVDGILDERVEKIRETDDGTGDNTVVKSTDSRCQPLRVSEVMGKETRLQRCCCVTHLPSPGLLCAFASLAFAVLVGLTSVRVSVHR